MTTQRGRRPAWRTDDGGTERQTSVHSPSAARPTPTSVCSPTPAPNTNELLQSASGADRTKAMPSGRR